MHKSQSWPTATRGWQVNWICRWSLGTIKLLLSLNKLGIEEFWYPLILINISCWCYKRRTFYRVFVISKEILHTFPKWLEPALTGMILGANKDNNLTYTSDGWQPKPHTVLSTTDRNLKLEPGYCNWTNTTALNSKQVHHHHCRISLASRHPTETLQRMFYDYLHISLQNNTIKNGNVMRHGELNKYHISFYDLWFLP